MEYSRAISGEAIFMAHNEGLSFEVPSTFWPCHDSALNMAALGEVSGYSSDLSNSKFYTASHFSGSSYYMNESHLIQNSSGSSMSMDFCLAGMKNSSSFLIERNDCLDKETSERNAEESVGYVTEAVSPDMDSRPIRGSKMSSPDSIVEDQCNNPSGKSKKRSRSSNEEDGNNGLVRQSLSSCSSEDDPNASQELNGGVTSKLASNLIGPAASNLKGKTRARRGSATDPQSLYARKRRERINERLRILQNLVPNGTKVDISTMLEEAVHYVKFLQHQIKLLSSDDLWMYTPIAYNGINIGLDLKITPLRKP
ncbi:hypothetical protein I3843_05G017100 [Carya illinoinensis]|nr:hypothetical protein I3843_05G017100 [Carya illinoinensis]